MHYTCNIIQYLLIDYIPTFMCGVHWSVSPSQVCINVHSSENKHKSMNIYETLWWIENQRPQWLAVLSCMFVTETMLLSCGALYRYTWSSTVTGYRYWIRGRKMMGAKCLFVWLLSYFMAHRPPHGHSEWSLKFWKVIICWIFISSSNATRCQILHLPDHLGV